MVSKNINRPARFPLINWFDMADLGLTRQSRIELDTMVSPWSAVTDWSNPIRGSISCLRSP